MKNKKSSWRKNRSSENKIIQIIKKYIVMAISRRSIGSLSRI
jgi:hypothetical protein